MMFFIGCFRELSPDIFRMYHTVVWSHQNKQTKKTTTLVSCCKIPIKLQFSPKIAEVPTTKEERRRQTNRVPTCCFPSQRHLTTAAGPELQLGGRGTIQVSQLIGRAVLRAGITAATQAACSHQVRARSQSWELKPGAPVLDAGFEAWCLNC